MIYSLKKGNLQARILYLARLSFRLEEEIKNFTDKKNKRKKKKEFSTTELAL